jgi:FkbM family methyltransferase
MLQRVKYFVIASGLEPMVRPVWNRLTGQPRKYDAETFAIIERMVPRDGVCIDVGCNKGFILDGCIKHCINGTFHAFEPIPLLARLLRHKYRRNGRVTVHQLALSSSDGEEKFFIDVAADGLSGLRIRDTGRKTKPVVVQVGRLDGLLSDIEPHFIKIDVEGAELEVLKGAVETLKRAKPIVVFEHGIGGADFFDCRPEEIFDLLTGCSLKVSLMEDLLASKPPLDRAGFLRQFDERLNYYFVAHP